MTAPTHQPSTGAKKPEESLAARTRTARTDATRPAAVHRREEPEERPWRHGHQGREERPGRTDTKDEKKDSGHGTAAPSRRGPRRRGSRPRRAGPHCGGAGPHCGRAGPHCGGAGCQRRSAPAPTAAPVAAPAPTATPVRRRAGPPLRSAPVPNVVAPVSDVIASVQDMLAPVAGAVVPFTQLQSLIQDMLTPVAGAVVPLTQLQSDLYSFLLGSVTSVALIQDMLTSVAGAVVPLTQLQSDLYSFLLGIAGMEPVAAGLGGVAGAGLSPAADASVASQWRLVLPLAGIPGGPLAGNAHRGCNARGDCVGPVSALTGTAPLAPNGAIPMGVQSFFRHADSELLLPGSALAGRSARRRRAYDLTAAGVLPISLAALAAVALPGVGGLVILTAAGVRVGYRQAKAGFALRTAGIARFARPGAVPLGVVRSGSLVVVRPRALRVVRPGALSAGCLLDKVA